MLALRRRERQGSHKNSIREEVFALFSSWEDSIPALSRRRGSLGGPKPLQFGTLYFHQRVIGAIFHMLVKEWNTPVGADALLGHSVLFIQGREGDGYPANLGLDAKAGGQSVESSRVRAITECTFLFQKDFIKEHWVLILGYKKWAVLLQLNLFPYSKNIFLLIIFHDLQEKNLVWLFWQVHTCKGPADLHLRGDGCLLFRLPLQSPKNRPVNWVLGEKLGRMD